MPESSRLAWNILHSGIHHIHANISPSSLGSFSDSSNFDDDSFSIGAQLAADENNYYSALNVFSSVHSYTF
jgi:hypothetical protein